MAKQRKRKKRSLPVRLLSGLLSLIDWICEGISALLVGLIGGILKGVAWLLCGLGRMVLAVLRGILSVPVRLVGRMTTGSNAAQRCLKLNGREFEEYVAQVLRDNGYKHVEVTRYSGDQGIDILAERGGKTYAIQCKNYVNVWAMPPCRRPLRARSTTTARWRWSSARVNSPTRPRRWRPPPVCSCGTAKS